MLFLLPHKIEELNNAYKNVDLKIVEKSTRKKLLCTFGKRNRALKYTCTECRKYVPTYKMV